MHLSDLAAGDAQRPFEFDCFLGKPGIAGDEGQRAIPVGVDHLRSPENCHGLRRQHHPGPGDDGGPSDLEPVEKLAKD